MDTVPYTRRRVHATYGDAPWRKQVRLKLELCMFDLQVSRVAYKVSEIGLGPTC